MEISEIFTRKNLEILKLLEKESLHIREIADRLNISPAKVHNTIQIFKKNGLVKETREKNKLIITLNKDNELLKKIENLIREEKTEEGVRKETIELFDTISPMDFRYYGRNEKVKEALKPYLSEEGFIRYLAKVEAALTNTLAKRGVWSKQI